MMITTEVQPTRRAVVRGGSADTISRYLYGNYEVEASGDGVVFIVGHDFAGFTLEAITDRLASGLYGCWEIFDA